jgi:hypothetical protein
MAVGGHDEMNPSGMAVGGRDEMNFSGMAVGGRDEMNFSGMAVGGHNEMNFSGMAVGGHNEMNFSEMAVGGHDEMNFSGMVAPEPGGFSAISRWLSEARATPPENGEIEFCIPEGCQPQLRSHRNRVLKPTLIPCPRPT